MSRDAADFTEASYFSDPSQDFDSLQDHVEEVITSKVSGLSSKQRERLAKLFISVLNKLIQDGLLGSFVNIKELTGRELLAALIGEIIDSPKPALMACCVDFAFNLGIQISKNETEIAEDHDVTKATVSRYCIQLKQVYLQGRPAPGMKSNAAVETYRSLRIGKSSRPPRQEWEFVRIFKSAYEN